MINYEMFFFFFFSSIVLTSAIFVIYSSNTVYSVFFLILAFVNSSGLLLLSEIEFIAFMLIIIYVGAITILFLFVVMMLDIPIQQNNEKLSNFGYLPILSFLIIIFFLETSLIFSKNLTLFYDMIYKSPVYSRFFNKLEVKTELDFITNIETLGQILYTYYSVFFLMAGIILLIALIGAVALTKKELRSKKVLQNDLFKQVSRNSLKAVFNIR